VPVCNCKLYYCAGVKEEGEKEKRLMNNFEGETEYKLLVKEFHYS